MDLAGAGKRIRIYIGESDQRHGSPLYLVILDTLRAEGCAGATVVRGIAGFGAHSRIHTASLLDVSADLPIVVEWIDTTDRVARVLPKVRALLSEGMITCEEIEVVFYQARLVSDLTNHLPVRDVMTTDVVTVQPTTPLRGAAALFIGKIYRAAPVVDDHRRVVGMVSNGDLVERGGLRVRLELLGILTAEQIAHELSVVEDGKTVADAMTSPAITVPSDAKLADVAHLMVTRRLKRVPVVDNQGTLLGIVSRADLLRTRSDAFPRPVVEGPPRIGRTIGEVMRTDIPVVSRTASLAEVVDAVVSTRLNRAIVVDEENHVVGVVSDAELLRRLSPEDHPSLVRILTSRLPFVHLGPRERSALAHALGKTAEDLMDAEVPTVPADSPLGEAIEVMIKGQHKLLPVVDAGGKLLGAADRADLLRTLVALQSQEA